MLRMTPSYAATGDSGIQMLGVILDDVQGGCVFRDGFGPGLDCDILPCYAMVPQSA
jgi:hypothetical protein